MLYLIFNLLPDSEKYGSFLLAAAKLDDRMLVVRFLITKFTNYFHFS